jgi:polar amino acid transport system substrate-binding protein
MKKLTAAMALSALIAAAFAAWTIAAPGKQRAAAGAEGGVAAGAKSPPLPAAVKQRGRWLIGVKCDFPPFGYVTAQGKNAGYDVEVARAFSRYAFGRSNRVSFTCVTTPSRIPTLQSKRVDIIISTLTFTKPRAEVIDFSVPYYGATGRLLVPNNSNITKLGQLSGKTVATTRGSIYDRWLKNCFKSTKVLLTDTTSASLLAMKDRRADAFMFDDAFLVGVAANDPDSKLTSNKFLDIPWGIGIRKGESDIRAWVNSRIRLMKKRDQFWTIMKHTVPRRFYKTFKDNVPRPRNTLKYPTGADAETVCP